MLKDETKMCIAAACKHFNECGVVGAQLESCISKAAEHKSIAAYRDNTHTHTHTHNIIYIILYNISPFNYEVFLLLAYSPLRCHRFYFYSPICPLHYPSISHPAFSGLIKHRGILLGLDCINHCLGVSLTLQIE